MIQVLGLDQQNLGLSESRVLELAGDGPFEIQMRCFVDKPSPPGPGFVPCPECAASYVVNSNQPFDIKCNPSTWSDKEGHIEINIIDSKGETRQLKLQIRKHPDKGTQSMFSNF